MATSGQGFLPVSFRASLEWMRPPTSAEFLSDSYIDTIEKRFEAFCRKVESLPRPDYSKPPESYSIPPILHFIWLGSPLPDKVRGLIYTWKRWHLGWKVHIWTDAEVENFSFSSERLQKAFTEAKAFSEKSDILRLEVLYRFGGIYSDTDVIGFKPFHDLIVHDISFFAGLEVNYTSRLHSHPLYVGAAIMGASAGHPIIRYSLDHYKTHDEAPELLLALRSGPGPLSEGCREYLAKEDVLILPCSYFFSLPCGCLVFGEDLPLFIAPESMAMHLWEGSWVT
jgi:mannosyltransferase OCH1-like enzyme